MTNRELYEHLERDTDGCKYWFRNNDVNWLYDADGYENIKHIFELFSKLVDNSSYHIIGNYLYFTFNNIKFYEMPSSYSDERTYIESLVDHLRVIGCKDFYYNCGWLD